MEHFFVCQSQFFCFYRNKLQSVPMEVDKQDRTKIVDSANRKVNSVRLMFGPNDHDPWTVWAYTPRTITLLVLGACVLV